MKKASDHSFEADLRSRLLHMEVTIPEGSFAAIQHRLRARRKRRLLLLWSISGILLFTSILYWQYEIYKNISNAQEQEMTISKNDTSLKKEEQETSIIPQFLTDKNSNNNELILQSSEQGELNNDFAAYIKDLKSTIKATQPQENDIIISDKKMIIVTDLVQPDTSFSESNSLDVQQMQPSLTHSPTLIMKTFTVEKTTFPSLLSLPSVITSVKKEHISWEIGVNTGLYYFHFIPNTSDDIHYFALGDQYSNFTFGIIGAARWQVSSRFSLLAQGIYDYSRADIDLLRLEKEAGHITSISNDLYANYSRQVEMIKGSFHQVGLGGALRYDFAAFSRQLHIQTGGNFLQSLDINKTSLFPRQELRLSMEFGLPISYNEQFSWVIRPCFSYGFNILDNSMAIKANRMTIGMNMSLSY